MKSVFLDAASNTPLDKRVFKAMRPYLKENFVGNSRSIHDFGIQASMAVEDSRSRIASVFGVDANHVMFTSGATEGNNLIIKGLAYREMVKGGGVPVRNHIICSSIEHDSVINPCKQLEKLGFVVDYVKPRDGQIHLEDVINLITDKTLLICVMEVNNELGTLNAASSIAEACAWIEPYPHVLIDCTQLVGYGSETINPHNLGCDYSRFRCFLTFSGHKIYGPGGVGCVIGPLGDLIDDGLIVGGAQEWGIRGGTTNVAGVVGLAAAVELISVTPLEKKYEDLFTYLVAELDRAFPNQYRLNAKPIHKNIVSINFGKYFNNTIDSLAARLAIEGIAVSAGSACDSQHNETSGDFNPSHVLSALGLSEHEIRCTIRVSFSKYTTKKDIDKLISAITAIGEGETKNYD